MKGLWGFFFPQVLSSGAATSTITALSPGGALMQGGTQQAINRKFSHSKLSCSRIGYTNSKVACPGFLNFWIQQVILTKQMQRHSLKILLAKYRSYQAEGKEKGQRKNSERN